MADLIERKSVDATVDAARDAAVQAYYADRVRVGATARTRAQAAQSIVTLFAGALVASFTFSALAKYSLASRISGMTAVAVWLAAAALYVRAIAAPVEAPPALADAEAIPSKIIAALVDRADHERKKIDRWRSIANGFSLVALLATLVTFGLALFGGEVVETRHGAIALNAEGTRAVQTLCGVTVNRIEGDVALLSTDTQFVAITVEACGADKNVLVRIARSGVESISTKDK